MDLQGLIPISAGIYGILLANGDSTQKSERPGKGSALAPKVRPNDACIGAVDDRIWRASALGSIRIAPYSQAVVVSRMSSNKALAFPLGSVLEPKFGVAWHIRLAL